MRGVTLLLATGLAAACGATSNRSVGTATDREPSTPGTASPSPQEGATPPVAAALPLDPESAPPPASGSDVVALVAGQPVLVSELLSAWVHRESPTVRTYVEELILSRLVLLEAVRLGIELPESALHEALADTQRRMELDVKQTGGFSGVEDYVRRRLGLDPERYLAEVREQTAIDLLASRVVRAWLLGSERAELRVIVIATREEAEAAQAAIEGGEDFAAVAERTGVGARDGSGGRVPPVVRGPTALARLAFATPVGEVGGPMLEGERWLILRVDARPPRLVGSWEEIGPQVEASLAQRDIEDPEYWQWKAHILESHEVDMRPLLELLGGQLAD